MARFRENDDMRADQLSVYETQERMADALAMLDVAIQGIEQLIALDAQSRPMPENAQKPR